MTLVLGTVRLLAFFNRINLEICRFAAIVLVAAIAVVVSAGVFWRYGLNDSLSWSEELAKFMMVWLVFVGAPVALRVGDHVAIRLLLDLMPGRLCAMLMAALSILIMWFCAMLSVYGFQFAWNGLPQVAIAIGDVSMFWVFSSIPFGAAVMFLVAAQQTLENLLDALAPGARKIAGFEKKFGSPPGIWRRDDDSS